MVRIAMWTAVVAVVGGALWAAVPQVTEAADPAPSRFNRKLKIGDAAPAFIAVGTDDKTYSLPSFKAAKAVVVIFTCNHCPVAQDYEDRFLKFAKDYKAKGVEVVGINVSTLEEDGLDLMKERAKAKSYPFPYVYDPSQSAGRAYGATVTPHLFVLDGQRKIAYMGAFDDNLNEPKVSRVYAREAVDAVLEGKLPEVAETQQQGCRIEYTAAK